MKYRIKYQMYHESFGGYDHKDGIGTMQVTASTKDEAQEKAQDRIHKKMLGGCQSRWATVLMIEEIKSKKELA